MSAADFPPTPSVASPSTAREAYFVLDPAKIMDFAIGGKQVRYPVFTLVVGEAPTVGEGQVLRTAEQVGIGYDHAVNYKELSAEAMAAMRTADYWKQRELTARSRRVWENLVLKLSRWHAAHFDK